MAAEPFSVDADQAISATLLAAVRLDHRRVATQVLTPAYLAMARVVAKTARRRNFGFTDRSGRLRRSIRARRPRRNEGNAFAVVSAGGPGARQAALVELGTRRSRPHQFLRRALRESVSPAYNAWVEEARRRFRKFEVPNRR